MSDAHTLHASVFTRFQVAFGEPQNSLGKDHYWSLRTSPGSLVVGMLLNGTDVRPALWVFHPGDSPESTFKTYITKMEEVDGLIKTVQDRLKGADGEGEGRSS